MESSILEVLCITLCEIGTAETQRMVQTLKLALKADHKGGVSLEKLLANFVLHYRVMPDATTGISHAS